MSMFCYQCQETAKGKGCEIRGVCGKTEEVAKLQDVLIYTLKGISEIVVKSKADISQISQVNNEVLKSLFMTITNANFDDGAIEGQIKKMLESGFGRSAFYRKRGCSFFKRNDNLRSKGHGGLYRARRKSRQRKS